MDADPLQLGLLAVIRHHRPLSVPFIDGRPHPGITLTEVVQVALGHFGLDAPDAEVRSALTWLSRVGTLSIYFDDLPTGGNVPVFVCRAGDGYLYERMKDPGYATESSNPVPGLSLSTDEPLEVWLSWEWLVLHASQRRQSATVLLARVFECSRRRAEYHLELLRAVGAVTSHGSGRSVSYQILEWPRAVSSEDLARARVQVFARSVAWHRHHDQVRS